MAAATQAATVVEKIIGNTSDATITTDVSNPAQKDYGDQDGARMKALTWNGKNSVKLGGFSFFFFSPLFSFPFFVRAVLSHSPVCSFLMSTVFC